MSEFLRITTLALADSVNPCAIAVLTMILISVLIENVEKRRKVLFSGLAFIASVLIGYMIYGIVIMQFFKTFAVFLRESSIYVTKGLAILAVLLGVLNIKDYLDYKPGSVGTEMPLFMRPKLKKIIKNITSPRGAFIIGFIVTLFLLPCTIGPYIIASGFLSELPFIAALPWLIYYNIIFVLPMLIITLLVYAGLTKVKDVQEWKERNIKYLHLIAGMLLIIAGIALFKGWL
jgi:cytochrome c biogenesis protein CcdA